MFRMLFLWRVYMYICVVNKYFLSNNRIPNYSLKLSSDTQVWHVKHIISRLGVLTKKKANNLNWFLLN